MLTKAAPATGPRVVLMPPRMTMTRMLTETFQPNWPGETMPRKEKHQPARPASAADRPNMPILTAAVRTPAAAANGSLSCSGHGGTSKGRLARGKREGRGELTLGFGVVGRTDFAAPGGGAVRDGQVGQ